ncbi:MAG: VgrG-related protein [Chloroflexi bacterium]|nr:VgrG-related protein [Chloroflexota bacterium]
MPTDMPLLPSVHIKFAGASASAAFAGDLLSVEVEDSLHVPSMCTLSVAMSSELIGMSYVDESYLNIGTELAVAVDMGAGDVPLFKGEITALEPHYNGISGLSVLVIRAYHKMHRLHNGRKTRTFTSSGDSDLFDTVAGEIGLTFEGDGLATGVHDWIVQDNETNWEFLTRRARRTGLILMGGDGKLIAKKVDGLTSASPLIAEWGVDIIDFRPRFSVAAYQTGTEARGWDVKQKQVIVGSSGTPARAAEGGVTGGLAAGQSAFGAAALAIVDAPLKDQSEAEALATAIANQVEGANLKADGVLTGNPAITAGSVIQFKNVGTRFSGKYLVTSALHRFDSDGYQTRIGVSGFSPDTLHSLLSGGAGIQDREVAGPRRTAAIAVVTNTDDPDSLSRVKVKYPWLSDQDESFWARMATPMAGNGRGFQFLPEVNDEVLVAFEHGDMHSPIVIGALWNGVDAPPLTSSEAVANGKTIKRTIKSTSGHTVSLIDKSGSESIEIIDKTTKNKVVITSSDNTITIESDAKVIVKSNEIDIKGTQKVNIEATDIILKGTNIKITADAELQMKGTAGATLDGGPNVEVKSSAKGSVSAGALLEVKGMPVKIN